MQTLHSPPRLLQLVKIIWSYWWRATVNILLFSFLFYILIFFALIPLLSALDTRGIISIAQLESLLKAVKLPDLPPFLLSMGGELLGGILLIPFAWKAFKKVTMLRFKDFSFQFSAAQPQDQTRQKWRFWLRWWIISVLAPLPVTGILTHFQVSYHQETFTTIGNLLTVVDFLLSFGINIIILKYLLTKGYKKYGVGLAAHPPKAPRIA